MGTQGQQADGLFAVFLPSRVHHTHGPDHRQLSLGRSPALAERLRRSAPFRHPQPTLYRPARSACSPRHRQRRGEPHSPDGQERAAPQHLAPWTVVLRPPAATPHQPDRQRLSLRGSRLQCDADLHRLARQPLAWVRRTRFQGDLQIQGHVQRRRQPDQGLGPAKRQSRCLRQQSSSVDRRNEIRSLRL